MKQLFTLLLLVISQVIFQSVNAQPQVVGSNQYGRIFDINYHPDAENTLYALTLGNHILKSTDNGITWDVFYSHPDKGSALKALRIMPDNKLSFYTAYTYNEDALYILDITTLEIEKHFVLPIPEGAEQTWINAYSLYPDDSDIALVLQGYSIGFSSFAKVYYTLDAGANWDEVYYNVDFNEIFPNNVAIDPSNPEKLFIARGNGPTELDGGLFISGDAGETWVEVLSGTTFDAITFHPQNSNDILLGSSISGDMNAPEDVYRSLDGGETWNALGIEWTDVTLDNINEIVYNPTNLNHIIVLEENEVVITTDNFQTWQNYVYDVTQTEGYVYGLTASFNPFNGQQVFINADYYPQFSSDGGVTMTRVLNPYFVSTGNVNLVQGESNHLYYGVQYGYLHRDLTTGVETPFEVKPIDYFSTNPGITYFTESSLPGRIYIYSSSFMGSSLKVSDDHGATQTEIMNLFMNSFDAIDTDPNNAEVAIASFSNFDMFEVYKIDFTDPGNIISTPVTLPYQDFVTGIKYMNGSSTDILMAIGTKMYKSDDGGVTWTLSNTGLEELIEFTDLILHLSANPLDSNQYTIASNKGIFTSKDGGATWQKIYDTLVHNIEHSTIHNGQLVGAVHTSLVSDFELIYSSDGGSTWNTVSQEELNFARSGFTAFHFFDESAEVYIGSDDMGLIKYSIALDPVATENRNVIQNVSIFPNPSRSSIYIQTGTGLHKVEIFDMTGQALLLSDKPVMDISGLNNGSYLVKITELNGRTTGFKLIKY